MKKIILSIMAVSALFACQKESSVETPQTGTVTFTAFVDGADTRTVLDGEALNTKWSGEEWIQIVGSKAYWFGSENVATPSLSTTFTYNGSNGEYTETGAVMAVYPAGSTPYAADLDNKTVGVLNVPAAQYPKAGSFDPNAAVAVAYTENSTLSFKNAVALLKFTMGADNITKACIYANGGGDISGTFSAEMTDGVPVLTGVTEGEGNGVSQWVDFYPGEGSAFVKGSDYYVAIAPATFPNGFGISFGDKEVKKYESSATFKRNVIYNMGTIGTDADSGDPVIPWAVSGAFNDWAQGADLEPMEQSGDYYVIKNVDKLDFYDGEDEGEDNDHGFKFIENGKDWRGGKGEVEAGNWDWVYDNDGQNIYVKNAVETDKFDIYLNPTTRKYVIVKAGTAMPEDKEDDPVTLDWAIVGSMPESAWNTNIAMTLEGEWRVAKNVTILISDGFKFRVGTDWETIRTYTDTKVVSGTVYTTIDGQGSDNEIKVEVSAIYDVYLSADAKKFKIEKVADYVEPEVTVETLYLNTGGKTLWNQANARFSAYFWADGVDAVWVDMTLVSGDVYKCTVPKNCKKVIFCRMNPEFTGNDWDKWSGDTLTEDRVWNQTSDLILSSNDCYTITGWNNGDGEWSKYSN